ncbi:hypothetical protein B0O80DRAFT_215404 [Mortierella sp. GBAus27b]|nr:hypothetical protein B0O80DRAFT_215404 [Mortierella sp. GBAus27b]
MSQSGSQPQEEAQPCNAQVSRVKVALDCLEILHIIGEWILVEEWITRRETAKVSHSDFQPKTMANCILVSKFWCEVLTPLLWSVRESRWMMHVPKELFTKYSQHVRIFDYATSAVLAPPMHTRLRRLTVESWDPHRHNGTTMHLIGANMNLASLALSNVVLFKRDKDKDVGRKSLSPTNPLGHLKSTLLELSLKEMRFEEKEFYYILRDVAEGNLRMLSLGWIYGSLDLQDLVFESLTRLHLRLIENMTFDLFEIIGRSPHLVHFELHDGIDFFGWYDGDSPPLALKRLGQFLCGAQPVIQWNSDPSCRQRTRPQLATLRLFVHHIRTQAWSLAEGVNSFEYLELIRACSNIYNRFKQTGYLGCLRDLDITLRNLDDDAREAIEMHKESLEVLKISISLQYTADRKQLSSTARHGQVLLKILESCRRLRELDYSTPFKDADIKAMVEVFIWGHTQQTPAVAAGQLPELSWDSPNLGSLRMYSTAPPALRKLEEGRLFLADGSNGHGHGPSKWWMPPFEWDPKVQDGTNFLIDAFGTGGGRELIEKFLRHVSPSRELKNLQLAQLKLVPA